MADDPDQDRMAPEVTWPGAPRSLIEVWKQRRRPLGLSADEALPALDCDLKALLMGRVAPEGDLPQGSSAHAQKRHETRRDLAGFSELVALNALLIAHLRKRRSPAHAAALFQRIWAEEGTALLAELPARWLISAAITFGDHGANEAQRRIGLAMNMLFSMMKLYEYERLCAGQPADQPFPIRRVGEKSLPLDMPRFSLTTGGLDINLMAQIWQMVGQDAVTGPLAHHLLNLLNRDPRGMFRRLNMLREDMDSRRAAKAERRATRGAAGVANGSDDADLPRQDGPKTAGT